MPTQFPSPLSSPQPPSAGAGPPPQGFSWTRLAERSGTIRLVLAGELDLAARDHLEAALADAQHDSARVVLDLRALTLVDCACLHVIFTAAARCRDRGGVLVLRHPRGQVRRVLDTVGAPIGVAVLDHSDFPAESLAATA